MMLHGPSTENPKSKPMDPGGQGPTEAAEASKIVMEGLLASSPAATELTGALGVETKQAALDAQLSNIQKGFDTALDISARLTLDSETTRPVASPGTVGTTPPPPLISANCSGYWLDPVSSFDSCGSGILRSNALDEMEECCLKP